MQISGILTRSVERYADKIAIVTEQRCATYRQLYEMAWGNVGALKTAGVKPGESVLLVADRAVEFLAGFFALQFLGAIPALMNPGHTPTEVAQAANTVGAAHIFAESVYIKELREALPRLPILSIALGRIKTTGLSPSDGIDEQLGLIRFTSGTTGSPKAVAYSHRNLTWGIADQINTGEPEAAYLCPLSLSIRFGRCCRVLGAGATIFVLDSFSAQKVAALSAHRNLHRVWASTVMLNKIMDEIDDRQVFRQVNGFSSVGSYLQPSLQQAFQDKFGVNIYQYYGQKESISLVEMPANAPPVLGSVGKAVAGTEVRIDQPDESGNGEIQYRSVRAAPGYMEQGVFKPRTPMAGGWYGTGDIGFLDGQGYLFVRGRSSSFINVGGMKASPGEIEDVLYQFPGVVAVKVTKVANFLMGEVPVAQVVFPGAGAEVKRALREFCRERLSKHKVPRRIILVPDLPVNAVGKMNENDG